MPPRKWLNYKPPIFGEIKDHSSDIHFFELRTQFISEDLLDVDGLNLVDFESPDRKQIEILVTSMPMCLVPGSQSSIEFLKEIKNLHDESFYNDFAQIIEYKWVTGRKFAYLRVGIIMIFIVLLNIEVITSKKNNF